MNFEEFFQTQLDQGKYATSNIAQRALEEGWIGCKKEVLKILYLRKTAPQVISDHLMNPDYQIDKAIKEIEKL